MQRLLCSKEQCPAAARHVPEIGPGQFLTGEICATAGVLRIMRLAVDALECVIQLFKLLIRIYVA